MKINFKEFKLFTNIAFKDSKIVDVNVSNKTYYGGWMG